jgi:hypothetical protein
LRAQVIQDRLAPSACPRCWSCPSMSPNLETASIGNSLVRRLTSQSPPRNRRLFSFCFIECDNSYHVPLTKYLCIWLPPLDDRSLRARDWDLPSQVWLRFIALCHCKFCYLIVHESIMLQVCQFENFCRNSQALKLNNRHTFGCVDRTSHQRQTSI